MGRYGQGTLFQRANGRWEGRLPDGKGGYKVVSGMDEGEVRDRLRALRQERDATPATSSRRGGERVRDLLTRWVRDVAPVRLRPRTVMGYERIIANGLRPLGHFYVRSLEPSDVQTWVNEMIASGLSPQTVHNHLRVLSGALHHAEREGLVQRNVARMVVLPRRTHAALGTLTTAEVRRFLTESRYVTVGDEIREDPDWPIWVVAATTGMRRGEVLSLRWQDIDWEARTVTVAGTYRFLGYGDPPAGSRRKRGEPAWAWEQPKTERSLRTLSLPALALAALQLQKGRARSATVVFARPDGKGPADPTQVTKRFEAALTRCGLPTVRLHALRHAAAVMMLDRLGGDLRAVSATLGHSTITTTVDTYGKAADEARRRAAAAMDDAMEGMG